jgi:hypothetical protein
MIDMMVETRKVIATTTASLCLPWVVNIIIRFMAADIHEKESKRDYDEGKNAKSVVAYALS